MLLSWNWSKPEIALRLAEYIWSFSISWSPSCPAQDKYLPFVEQDRFLCATGKHGGFCTNLIENFPMNNFSLFNSTVALTPNLHVFMEQKVGFCTLSPLHCTQKWTHNPEGVEFANLLFSLSIRLSVLSFTRMSSVCSWCFPVLINSQVEIFLFYLFKRFS